MLTIAATIGINIVHTATLEANSVSIPITKHIKNIINVSGNSPRMINLVPRYWDNPVFWNNDYKVIFWIGL